MHYVLKEVYNLRKQKEYCWCNVMTAVVVILLLSVALGFEIPKYLIALVLSVIGLLGIFIGYTIIQIVVLTEVYWQTVFELLSKTDVNKWEQARRRYKEGWELKLLSCIYSHGGEDTCPLCKEVSHESPD